MNWKGPVWIQLTSKVMILSLVPGRHSHRSLSVCPGGSTQRRRPWVNWRIVRGPMHRTTVVWRAFSSVGWRAPSGEAEASSRTEVNNTDWTFLSLKQITRFNNLALHLKLYRVLKDEPIVLLVIIQAWRNRPLKNYEAHRFHLNLPLSCSRAWTSLSQ